MYDRVIKRCLDVMLSGLALVVLAMPMGIVAVAIKLDDPGRAIFCQRRMGANGTSFRLYKFRSMRADAPDVPKDRLEAPERYITRVGRFLRRTSIDELPQLWNVFKGDMSMVGPRPILPQQRELLWQRECNGAGRVRPGITGWAQINGRDALTDREKARLDGEYVKRESLGFDAGCLLRTLPAVLRQRNVIEGGPQK